MRLRVLLCIQNRTPRELIVYGCLQAINLQSFSNSTGRGIQSNTSPTLLRLEIMLARMETYSQSNSFVLFEETPSIGIPIWSPNWKFGANGKGVLEPLLQHSSYCEHDGTYQYEAMEGWTRHWLHQPMVLVKPWLQRSTFRSFWSRNVHPRHALGTVLHSLRHQASYLRRIYYSSAWHGT